jgi:hypothetical protein
MNKSAVKKVQERLQRGGYSNSVDGMSTGFDSYGAFSDLIRALLEDEEKAKKPAAPKRK